MEGEEEYDPSQTHPYFHFQNCKKKQKPRNQFLQPISRPSNAFYERMRVSSNAPYRTQSQVMDQFDPAISKCERRGEKLWWKRKANAGRLLSSSS